MVVVLVSVAVVSGGPNSSVFGCYGWWLMIVVLVSAWLMCVEVGGCCSNLHLLFIIVYVAIVRGGCSANICGYCVWWLVDVVLVSVAIVCGGWWM